MSAQQALPGVAAPSSPPPAAVAPPPAGDEKPKGATDGKEAKPPASPLADGAENKDEQVAAGDGKPGAGELEIKLPEGLEVDAAALGEFKALAQELKLDGAAASKLVAWSAEREAKAIAEMHAEGERQLRADKDFGGKVYKQTLEEARRAIRKYGDEGGVKTLELLINSPVGSDPGFIRMMARVGRLLSDDSSAGGGKPPAQQSKQDELRAMYPNSPKLFEPKA